MHVSNHSGAKGLPFCIQKQYFIIQEGGTKEFFEMQLLPFNLCAKYCLIIPLLVDVHWLPVKFTIEFKVLLILRFLRD